MADHSYNCGPNAIDEFNNYRNNKTTHYVSGTGTMNSNNAVNNVFYAESYQINSGITELGDSCLSRAGITAISLPDTLVKIGSSCFKHSRISSIELPESLTEIGHDNFPSTLTSITIPANLEVFPTDNLQGCPALPAIRVAKNNKAFKSIDGILYNYDVTEALLCPRGKVGKVVIPNTVKRIAERCFSGCISITMIDLPRGLEIIEDYAFSWLKLERLVIPNTVTYLGKGCFALTTISKTFKFPQKVTKLQEQCFYKADIPSFDFLKNIEIIGMSCFSDSPSFPEYLRLSKIRHIDSYAFCSQKNIKYIELPTTLSHIGAIAFPDTADNLKLISLSIAPSQMADNAFQGLSENATLYVPKGTKLIYENTPPWSTIQNIAVFNVQRNFEDEDSEITDEQLFARLKSIAMSAKNANRIALKDLLYDVAQSYKYVDNDEDYIDAMELIKYNRRFIPALIPDFEQEICADWTVKYKLRLASTYLFNFNSAAAKISPQTETSAIESDATTALPMLANNRMDSINLIHDLSTNVDVHCSDILLHLQNELSTAETSVRIAVSWFTNYALFKQIKELAQKGLNIELIINNDSVNNGGYCLDFNELIEAGVHISLIEYPHLLHHKFCIIDDNVVINGSYNWTRFSGKNYENIMIFRGNDYITDNFNQEFENILQKAEYKDITAMPESVPQRPEYDRNAFKQYITEELDAEARETSEQRDKITALQKAARLNPTYLEKINPEAKELKEAFNVANQAAAMKKEVVSMANGGSSAPNRTSNVKKTTSAKPATKTRSGKKATTITKEEQAVIEQIKASDLFMVLDVSGSMGATYQAGHVSHITKKAVAAALAISDSQKVSLWKFGDSSTFVKDIGLENLGDINQVTCMNSGTELNQFVLNANSSIKDGSLVIIFTDDDGASIRGAVNGMNARSNVFWQIIVLGDHSQISSTINGCKNISLVSMDDYASKSDSEINQALLKDYINWKKGNSCN